MSRLSNTEESFIKQQIADETRNVKVGRVVEVHEHTSTDDSSNFEVDVRILGGEVQHRSIPYEQKSNGEIAVPTVGDKVVVEYQDGVKKVPIARDVVYTNRDRAPIGKAGMWRKEVESGSSAAGDGNLYLESYTNYDGDPSTDDPDTLTVLDSWIRLAKKVNADDSSSLPVNIELFDDPNGNAAHVKVEINKDGGVNSANTWGLLFNLSDGSFKVLDADGYGIVSDGAGNFTWHHEDVNFSEGTTTSL